ncbi:AraC family transcriptional regulator [Paenibacillus jamilae]|uniref:AraC family transcriptional regulator n=1 Tax=Paenibacillus jamilae TaxID=114136 RepID=A0ACC4ZTY1_9BACL|nr:MULTISPECIES: AraC family transcriptional regulator [Paenibacillus]AUO07791.1 AraC family transcriptional regulator [Paenibacillus sp. lzh-N1]KTS81912.1 AraC family transcriptional regulator [Paenibacillus jamilae]
MKATEIRSSTTEKQAELPSLIEQFTSHDGVHATDIPSLYFVRSSNTTVPIYQVHEPALCIVAQGRKVVILAEESYYYGTSDYLVVSVDLPISGQVIQASTDAPYLCLRLNFDPHQVLDLIKESTFPTTSIPDSRRGLYVSQTNSLLLDAVVRLVHLLERPQDIPVLAPLVIREILYRILQGKQGESLKQLVMTGSHSSRIAEVIKRIKQDYDKPLRIEELSQLASMSPSSLHRHFKEVTAMSPMQYQKQLRLQEARRLLLSESADAADVGFQVGYESPSQFSREYARLFGLPPIRDTKRLRVDQDHLQS